MLEFFRRRETFITNIKNNSHSLQHPIWVWMGHRAWVMMPKTDVPIPSKYLTQQLSDAKLMLRTISRSESLFTHFHTYAHRYPSQHSATQYKCIHAHLLRQKMKNVWGGDEEHCLMTLPWGTALEATAFTASGGWN